MSEAELIEKYEHDQSTGTEKIENTYSGSIGSLDAGLDVTTLEFDSKKQAQEFVKRNHEKVMQLKSPFLISTRLLPAIKVEDCTISLERENEDAEGRQEFRMYFDFDDGRSLEEVGLKSGCGGVGGGTQEMFATLFTFMSAAAESRQYRERTGQDGENEGLFSQELVDWISHNSAEISYLAYEVEETEGLIVD